MNKTTYTATRRSIRDNGFRYTLQHAIDTDDTDTMLTCGEIHNALCDVDWLAMRVLFRRTDKPAVAFKLTTPVWDAHKVAK